MKNRIWIDGCFDLFHFGHANALRQAKGLGGTLICGINSFDDIYKNKGIPVFTDEEREEIVKSCRWVDEVVSKVPYSPSVELIKKFNCDYAVHGDDLACDENGVDVYAETKALGLFKEIGRTKNISTTEIVGRLLLQEKKITVQNQQSTEESLFYKNMKEIFKLPCKKKEGTVVFIDGIFDLYHAGHCKAIENAKKNGDYLIVGLVSDSLAKEYLKVSPILNENERYLVLMSNKYVDEIIMSPSNFDEDFIRKHRISKVFRSPDIKDLSRFQNVKENFIFDNTPNPFSELSTEKIVNRIILNYQLFLKRQNSKISND